MYAYGGYNTDMPPWYTEMVTSINVAEWVEAGNVYVHANIRGGSEYGPRWHEAGIPTPSEAKKQGMTYAEWCALADMRGV